MGFCNKGDFLLNEIGEISVKLQEKYLGSFRLEPYSDKVVFHSKEPCLNE